MYYHLRFTPYELSSENLTTFCDKYDSYVIAHERFKKDGITATEPHYHCWISTDLDLDSVRTAFKKAMCIPTGGRGRNNKYYSLEKWEKKEDICYIVKQGIIVSHKGITEDRLRVLPCCDKKDQGSPLGTPMGEKVEEINSKMNSTKKQPNFWTEIVYESMLFEKKTGKKIEIEEALKQITKVYFRKGLPLPHPGDRKRWATSLQMYSKMKWTYTESEEHDKIIEDEALFFQANEMGNKA